MSCTCAVRGEFSSPTEVRLKNHSMKNILARLQTKPGLDASCGFLGIGRAVRLLVGIITGIWLNVPSVFAVLFYATADPSFNTSPPTGALAGSGWQYQGKWGPFLGTVIGPNQFITAGHVGGGPGDKFHFRNVEYVTVSFVDDPETDLRVWTVNGRFPEYAPWMERGDEVGKAVVIFGRGTQRGETVMVSGLLGGSTKGWKWGAADHVQRWGENTVTEVVNGSALGTINGNGGGIGELLRMTFDAGGGPNEAHLSAGDSGGGLFVRVDGVWKLAAVNYAVDGSYNTVGVGAGFAAAVFDEGGLYEGTEGNWRFNPDLPSNQPGGFYATRISSRANWIRSVIAMAPVEGIAVESTSALPGSFTRTTSTHDANTRTLRVPMSGASQFYRLQAPLRLRIASTRIEGGYLVVTYETAP